MGNKTSLQISPEEIAEIQTETGFTEKQIERLYARFTVLGRGNSGFLLREDLYHIPELAINPLADRIVNAFFAESNNNRVNFRQFMNVLAHFQPIQDKKENKLNSREDKLRFAFQMYDLDGDGVISRDELLSILKTMVGASISQEELYGIVQRTIAEADLYCQGNISFEDFVRVMERSDVEEKMSVRFKN